MNTGYILPNKLFLIVLIIISTSSLLIRNNFLEDYKENLFLFYTILYFGILYIIYIVFNLICRITITKCRGFPYFITVLKWSRKYGYFM